MGFHLDYFSTPGFADDPVIPIWTTTQMKVRLPPQEAGLVYKTNLTNRHEKILMSGAKVTI